MNIAVWLTIELAIVAFFVFGYILWRRRRGGTTD